MLTKFGDCIYGYMKCKEKHIISVNKLVGRASVQETGRDGMKETRQLLMKVFRNDCFATWRSNDH